MQTVDPISSLINPEIYIFVSYLLSLKTWWQVVRNQVSIGFTEALLLIGDPKEATWSIWAYDFLDINYEAHSFLKRSRCSSLQPAALLPHTHFLLLFWLPVPSSVWICSSQFSVRCFLSTIQSSWLQGPAGLYVGAIGSVNRLSVVCMCLMCDVCICFCVWCMHGLWCTCLCVCTCIHVWCALLWVDGSGVWLYEFVEIRVRMCDLKCVSMFMKRHWYESRNCAKTPPRVWGCFAIWAPLLQTYACCWQELNYSRLLILWALCQDISL